MRPDELAAQLRIEVDLMHATLGEVDALVTDLRAREPVTRETAATAHFLEDLYMGLENILVRICKDTGVPTPNSSDWHRTLLAMFGPSPAGSLPLLLDADLARDVARYRRFRHLSTHGYGVTLSWMQLAPLAANARPVFACFLTRVSEYMASLPTDDPSQECPA